MALSQPYEIQVFFDEVCKSFETNNIMATETNVFRKNGLTQQNSNDVTWRPEAQIGRVTTGLDQTGQYGNVLELSVPSTLDTIINDPFQLNALELRDRRFMEKRAKAAGVKLAADINVRIADLVASTGSIVVNRTAPLASYADIAQAETVMDESEIAMNDGRSMFLNSRDYNSMSGNLAARQTIDPSNAQPALRKSDIGNFAGFDTFRTNFQPVLAGNTVGGGETITGNQFHIPVANQTVGGQTIPVDNRGMTLTVSATANLVAGDAFIIAGVNEVSHINKIDTGRQRTFRILSIDSGTTMTIYPRLVPVDQIGVGLTAAEGTYANCTTQAAGAAVITIVNDGTGTAGGAAGEKVNSFWRDDTVQLVAGELAWDADMFPGATFMSQTMDNGITLVLMKQGDTLAGVSSIRLTAFCGFVNLDPQQNGILGNFSATVLP